MPSSHRRATGRRHRTTACRALAIVAFSGVAVGLPHPSIVTAQATCSSTKSIVCGEVQSGNVGTLGETDCFEFTAEAGEVVHILSKAVSSTVQACAQLRDPEGNVVGPAACGQPATLTLPATGTYTIRLFDRSNDQTGAYAVQLQVLSATTSSCPAATIPCGATPAGVLASIVESDIYRFVAAEAGEVVSITTADVATPFVACWQLYAGDGGPIGTLKCGQDSRMLPAAGPYTIRVFDLANDDTGTYRVDVNVLSATATSCHDSTLVCGATHAGTIAALGDNDVYWFTTTSPNEVVDITTATTSGTMNACWLLYAADGTSAGPIICGHDERVLVTPGTYVLRVFDLTYEGAGTYDVAVKTAPACPAISTPTPTGTPTVTPTGASSPDGTGGDGTATPVGTPSSAASSGATPTPDGLSTSTPPGAGTPTTTSSSATSGPGGTPTPQGTPTVQSLEAVLDDFLCYATKLTRGGPPFVPALGMRLSDTLESSAFNVGKPTQLCAPADKNGDGIADPGTSLDRYRIQRERGTPRYARSTRRVVTALGTLSLDTLRPDQLLVPTAQSAVAPPTAPDAETHHVDRYKCYRVRVTKKTPKIPFDLQVTVTDLLSSPGRRFKVKSPTRLCLTTNDAPASLHNPAGHLLCYPVRLVRGEAKHVKQRGLYLGNELGPTRVDTSRESELCVPALFAP